MNSGEISASVKMVGGGGKEGGRERKKRREKGGSKRGGKRKGRERRKGEKRGEDRRGEEKDCEEVLGSCLERVRMGSYTANPPSLFSPFAHPYTLSPMNFSFLETIYGGLTVVLHHS